MEIDIDPRVDGWRLKFGKINHSTCDYPNNYTRLIPEGVKVVATSLGVSVFNEEDHLAAARERRRVAAEQLDEWGVDCILAGGGPTHALEGADAEAEFIAEMNDELDAPFTTSLEAQIDALRAIGAESILAVTPFPDDREQETKDYFEAQGFDVVAIGGPGARGSVDARSLHSSTSYQHAVNLARRVDDEFDAVYIAGSPFGSADHIEPLERDVGCPVVMSAQAQVWKAFELGGIDPEMDEFGHLFRET